MGHGLTEVGCGGGNLSSCSWRCRDCNGNNQSQLLQSVLSELDACSQAMLQLLDDPEDGDTFAQRAEMYYQKRPELLAKARQFQRAYHLLSQYACGAAWSGSHSTARSSRVAESGGSPASDDDSVMSTAVTEHSHRNARVPTVPLTATRPSVPDDERELQLLVLKEMTEERADEETNSNDDDAMVNMEKRVSCSEQISKIVEDTVAELARRNAENWEAKRKLEERMDALIKENASLHQDLDKARRCYDDLVLKLDRTPAGNPSVGAVSASTSAPAAGRSVDVGCFGCSNFNRLRPRSLRPKPSVFAHRMST